MQTLIFYVAVSHALHSTGCLSDVTHDGYNCLKPLPIDTISTVYSLVDCGVCIICFEAINNTIDTQ